MVELSARFDVDFSICHRDTRLPLEVIAMIDQTLKFVLAIVNKVHSSNNCNAEDQKISVKT
eukprot:IDg8937t1